MMRTWRTCRCLQYLSYSNSPLNAAGSDLSGTEHAACALDFGFYVCRKTLEGKREGVEEGVVSRNRATVAHVANAE